jgi:hypothetical protein
MVAIFNILTFIWLAAWALYSVRCLARGASHSILFVIIIHFFFAGVPLLLDLTFGQPTYFYKPGFFEASRDQLTSILYCLYVSACPLLWWWIGRSRNTEAHSDISAILYSPVMRLVYYTVLTLPLVLVYFSPAPAFYKTYGAVATMSISAEQSEAFHEHHVWITWAGRCVLVAGGLLLLSPKRKENVPVILFWLFLTAWINGKRNFVAIEILLLMYAYWRKGYLRGKTLAVVGCSAVVLLGAFSCFYQHTLRGIDTVAVSLEEVYENVRIDYGRDDCIKLTIYTELYPEEGRILEYRGQSCLFYPSMFIPRRVWPDKPWPYSVYFTARMLEMPVEHLGWTMTTSVLEEAIANFGWWGMILGPLLISVMCRIGDSCGEKFVQVLTVLTTCLLLLVHLAVFLPIAMTWFLLVGWIKWTGMHKAATRFAVPNAPTRYRREGPVQPRE